MPTSADAAHDLERRADTAARLVGVLALHVPALGRRRPAVARLPDRPAAAPRKRHGAAAAGGVRVPRRVGAAEVTIEQPNDACRRLRDAVDLAAPRRLPRRAEGGPPLLGHGRRSALSADALKAAKAALLITDEQCARVHEIRQAAAARAGGGGGGGGGGAAAAAATPTAMR